MGGGQDIGESDRQEEIGIITTWKGECSEKDRNEKGRDRLEWRRKWKTQKEREGN